MNALILNGSGNFNLQFALLHYDQLKEENAKKSSFNLKFLKELLSTGQSV